MVLYRMTWLFNSDMKEDQTRKTFEFLGNLLNELALINVENWKDKAWEMIDEFEKGLQESK